MNQYTVDTTEPSPSRWRSSLAWGTLLIVALLAFEVTANPAVGVAVACLKFGWEDWLSALWLRRADPDPQRGRACFWMYGASGLWKSSIVAFLAMFAMPLLAVFVANPRARALGPYLVGAALMALGGFGTFLIAGWIAIGVALRNRVKVWVGPEAHWARRRNHWPPQPSAVASWR